MKKFTILTFALLLSACAVGPPYPNERDRRAQDNPDGSTRVTYTDSAGRPYYYDNYGQRYYYNDYPYRTRYDYYGHPNGGHYHNGVWYDNDHDHDNRNWDGSNRFYNRNN